ncbi:glycosyl transferase family 90-domain-containing protein [Aspergillus pseudoustus]|uniref:Glycosyl transferase family 90-domain-containing protein n=1 Tax=Aspergillus pseudoustus TaxID=1810923 RepID=A0ABR4KFL7_9EURO
MSLPPRWRQHQTLLSSLSVLSIFGISLILLLWFTVNSDRSYLHPLLTQMIPAGHSACETATVFRCDSCLTCSHQTNSLTQSPDKWQFEYARDGNNVALSREQCSAAFPGLVQDIARANRYWRSQSGLSSAELDTITLKQGMARARIANGELYVLAARARREDHRRKIISVLSAMHRALVTDTVRRTSLSSSSSSQASRNHRHRHNHHQPIEFVFSIEDKLSDVADPAVADPIWTLARTASEEAAWLMPDFGFWTWEHAHTEIGPYDAVVEDAVSYDALPWAEKRQQLVWRGKPSFAPKLRRALLDKTRGREWADVQAVDWHQEDQGAGQGNALGMGEHCRYGFIAHVEGRSYSGSLKYRQACRSVIVAHKLQYIQHHHYLLVSSGPSQNYVEVERDFSDLEDKVVPLLADTEKAQRIADNSVRTFRERYLTPAAEACYWRSLWDGYAGVFNETGKPERRGMRYESFILQGSEALMEFDAR